MRYRSLLLGCAAAAAFAAFARADAAPEPPRPSVPAPSAAFKQVTLADNLDHPWSIAFLPGGDMLVTERPGRLRIIRGGAIDPTPIAGTPDVYTQEGGQGGLFDVVLHPKFAENNLVYLTYAMGNKGENATRVARARFDGKALTDFQVIFTATSKDTANHFGARLVFIADGTFLLTVGDGFEYREKAQDPSVDLGKIVRLNDDGTVPADNPFAGRPNFKPEVYTLGHRNEQGLFYDAQTNRVWETEHGPRGGDELNIIQPGKNYGWPLITYGMDYSGAYVSPYTERPGLEQPVVYWTPSIAPSGLTIYRGDKFPQWNGDAFVGALALKHLRRVHFGEDGKVASQEVLLEGQARIRDVRTGPDGYLYILSEGDKTNGGFGDSHGGGRVFRLEPQ